MVTCVLNIQIFVRITPCPPRLELQTLWTWVILMGKMTFRRAKCFAKIVHTMETGVLNIQTPIRISPFILHIQILS